MHNFKHSQIYLIQITLNLMEQMCANRFKPFQTYLRSQAQLYASTGPPQLDSSVNSLQEISNFVV